MDYAIQLLLPILGGLVLGIWLTQNYGISPIWTVILAILGMVGGIGIIYKRFSYPELYPDSKKESKSEATKPLPVRPKSETLKSHTKPSAQEAAKEAVKSVPIDQLSFLYEEPDHERNREEFDLNLDIEDPDDVPPKNGNAH